MIPAGPGRDATPAGLAAAAALLFLGPVLFRLADPAAGSAVVLGLVGLSVAIKIRTRPDASDPWLAVATGAVMALMPWLLGFGAGAATWLHLAVGGAFAATGSWRRLRLRTRPDADGDGVASPG